MANGRKLRCGYTTGSCAAAATKAAVRMLLTGSEVEEVSLVTPSGKKLHLLIEEIGMENPSPMRIALIPKLVSRLSCGEQAPASPAPVPEGGED